jgi:predicted TIM-barrel fold metal-dependent hydrolase
MKHLLLLTFFSLSWFSLEAQKVQLPVIDVHLHAFSADWVGHPDSAVSWMHLNLSRPQTDEQLMKETFEIMKQYNIVEAVASGPFKYVDIWKEFDEKRIKYGCIRGIPDERYIEELRNRCEEGKLDVLGEVTSQYGGISPSDSILDLFYSLAEEFDIPIGLHMGLGPPGCAYNSKYRMRLSSALLLEEALIRHPKLRLYVMHAGWPLLDDMIALLYCYPNVYVDVAVINWYIPRKEFHAYLKRLVDAGFIRRIMFGSDNMVWPEAIKLAIEGIESADFLTEEQKRDIFYNNAARFLRLTKQEIEAHYKIATSR